MNSSVKDEPAAAADHVANGTPTVVEAHPPGNVLAHHFENLDQQREANSLGMWMFLSTELLIFGGLFLGYTVYRTLYTHEFEAASGKLSLRIATINTIVLLTSSLTMVLAVFAAETGNRVRLVRYLLITAALGALFLLIKSGEYTLDYYDGLMPPLSFNNAEWLEEGLRPEQVPHVKLFLALYYIMTGLHAVHLIIGISVLLVMAALAHRGYFPKENFIPIELWGLYWHFVDVVWIFLFPLLYLIGTRRLF